MRLHCVPTSSLDVLDFQNSQQDFVNIVEDIVTKPKKCFVLRSWETYLLYVTSFLTIMEQMVYFFANTYITSKTIC